MEKLEKALNVSMKGRLNEEAFMLDKLIKIDEDCQALATRHIPNNGCGRYGGVNNAGQGA